MGTVSAVEDRLDMLTEKLKARVVETHRLNQALNACYVAEKRVIYVRKNLDPATRACAIAHELGHVFYGHDCSTPRFEYQADRWAAEQLLGGLVAPGMLLEYRSRPGALAAELGVTPRFLQVWLQLHHLGNDYPRVVF